MSNINIINKIQINFFSLFLWSLFLSLGVLGVACSNDSQRVALWRAGSEDGNFGFGLCQQKLDEEEGALSQSIKTEGFSVGYFFGSTNSYNFIDLIKHIGVDKESKISTFDLDGVVNKGETKIEDFLVLSDGNISSSGLSLLNALGVTGAQSVWSFSDAAGAYHSENCMDAKNNSSAEKGRALQGSVISQSSIECSVNALVLCMAK